MDDHTVEPHDPTTAALLAEVAALRAEVDALRRSVPAIPAAPGRAEGPVTRRAALRLAGATSVGIVAGTLAGAAPAGAADPNDVVKNVNNAVSTSTTMTGSVNGPILHLINTGSTGRGLFAQAAGKDAGAVRGDNSNSTGTGGVGVAGHAPGGRDLQAAGSGRISMVGHDYDTSQHGYTAGELHQKDGTLYAMVGPTSRRVLASPASAGAFHPLTPSRVYDSRSPAPSPGSLGPGTNRLVSVAAARNLTTGAVTNANLVPAGATAVVFNLTITGTSGGSGFLSVTPGGSATFSASSINWTAPGTTVANGGVVPLDSERRLKVFCGGGSTHFIIDVVGYYR